MGPPAGTGSCSLQKLSTNISGRDVTAALTHVGTTASVLITPPVDLMVSHMESPSKPQSPMSLPLPYGMYPPPETFTLPLSRCVTHYGCGLAGGGGTLLCKSGAGVSVSVGLSITFNT